jgi:hypothetical protein
VRRRRGSASVPLWIGILTVLIASSITAFPSPARSASTSSDEVGLRVVSAPKGVVTRHFATVLFTANPDAEGFTCKLDNRPHRPCSSPVTFRHLSSGTHSLQIGASIRREDGGESADVLLRWTIR